MKNFHLLILAVVVLLPILFFISCNESDDVDDNDDDQGDDWEKSSDGCHFIINGSGDEGTTATVQSLDAADYEDCIPEIPDDQLRNDLIVLLDAYLGDYLDDNSETKQILCRPEGEWILPDRDAELFCIFHFTIPVWVVMDENESTVEGTIRNDDASTENLLKNTRWLKFTFENELLVAKHNLQSEIVQWLFFGPDDELLYTWTKVE